MNGTESEVYQQMSKYLKNAPARSGGGKVKTPSLLTMSV